MLDERPANDDLCAPDWRGRPELLQEIDLLREALQSCAARIATLNRLANIDPLVELPNRRSFVSRLESSISQVNRSDTGGAVLFLDVDGLKSINDTFGHDAGDEALVEVAKLLAVSVRSGDVVARLAGDEFGVILEGVDELSAWRMALRLVEAVDGSQFCVNQVCVPLSVAVGVAMIRRGDAAQAVISRADREMYRIKAMR